jgi:hypothetical protein
MFLRRAAAGLHPKRGIAGRSGQAAQQMLADPDGGQQPQLVAAAQQREWVRRHAHPLIVRGLQRSDSPGTGRGRLTLGEIGQG